MYEKTALFITPQEIKNKGEVMNNYINDNIFKDILKKNGWIILDYNTINLNKYKKRGIGLIYITGDITYNKVIYSIPVYIKNLFELKSHRRITNKYDLYLSLKNYSYIQNNIIESYNIDELDKLPDDNIYIARPIGGYEGKGIKNLSNNQDFIYYKYNYEYIKKKYNYKKLNYL